LQLEKTKPSNPIMNPHTKREMMIMNNRLVMIFQ
jgi:hypothetical protein